MAPADIRVADQLAGLIAKAETAEQWAEICGLEAEMLTPAKPSVVPSRDRITLRVFRVGATEPFFTISGWPRDHRAPEYQRICADYWQCDADDVSFGELSDGTETVLIRGNIVGAFGRAVELGELLAESAALTDGSR